MSNTQHRVLKVWTNFCKVGLSLIFIFSGFIKANDPWGTFYKVEEYFRVFGVADSLPSFVPLFCAVMLGVFEFSVGIYLLLGIRRKFTAVVLLAFLAVMTPLTLYLAIANPIEECGCFGDVVHLTNWETFGKNFVFLVGAVSLFRWYDLQLQIVSTKSQWLASIYTILFIFAVTGYSYTYLPVFDFSPYHIGASIQEGMRVPEGEKAPVLDVVYVMQRGSERREFTVDNYPDSTWTLVEAKTVVKEPGYNPPILDLPLTLTDTGERITEQVLEDDGYTFLLVSPWLGKADEGYIDLINELYDYSVEYGYPFYCATASSDDEVRQWCEHTGAEYPFCESDESTLKTMVRSNPGLLLLRHGTVVNKWSCASLPDEYELRGPLDQLPLAHITPSGITRKVLVVLAWFILPFALLVLVDRLLVMRMNKQR